MTRIGLTGGIGSGKSTVARMLIDRGACLVDADRIARDLVAPGSPALEQLAAEFGSQIIAADGSLDRSGLAAIAFADEASTARLNAIMHPLIRAEAEARMDALPGNVIVVYDMPLLVETKQGDVVDVIVVVDVPEEVQVARAELRGLDPQDVRRRMAAQASRAQRCAVADVVIDNSGSPEDTERQVTALWQRLVERTSPGPRI